MGKHIVAERRPGQFIPLATLGIPPGDPGIPTNGTKVLTVQSPFILQLKHGKPTRLGLDRGLSPMLITSSGIDERCGDEKHFTRLRDGKIAKKAGRTRPVEPKDSP